VFRLNNDFSLLMKGALEHNSFTSRGIYVIFNVFHKEMRYIIFKIVYGRIDLEKSVSSLYINERNKV
jgi:hypothetical protein